MDNEPELVSEGNWKKKKKKKSWNELKVIRVN